MADSIIQFDVQQLVDSWLEAERNGDRFPVPFDTAWVIAGYQQKGHAKRKLTGKTSMLVEGEDYLSRSGEWTDGGRSSDSIQLTCDAFKQFCLMAGTEEGKQTRLYFIAAEKRLKEIQSRPMRQVDLLVEQALMLRDHADRIERLSAENERLKLQMHTLESNQDETRLHLTESQQRIDRWDAIQSKARENLIALPQPSSEVPEETLDMKVRRIANSYCAATGQGQSDVFKELYKQHHYRYRRRVQAIGRESKLQAFVRLNLIQSLYDLAVELFADRQSA